MLKVKDGISTNASSATKLQTARKLTVGNTGKTFNGSADVSWSLSEIGAAASSHTHQASQVTFTDGKTFQQKLDDGSLKGAKGDTGAKGATGATGATGPQGAKGADGLTTSVTVGSTKYTHVSGNITIPAYPTLSSLGAAPAGYGLGTTCKDVSSQDCNNITTTGFYRGSNMTNKPSGCTQGWIYLLVMQHDSSWIRQVAYDYGTASQVYTRVKNSGTWSAWVATDTNTWRGVQDNLTSSATDQSLSANQGKVLKGLIDGKAASSHTHNYAGSSSAGGAANSATVLATARTINGTSFNGSANITTANWGTARTITIGNTGKSVNGSGNVSWSLSEIGAAAASHTHNYASVSHTHSTVKYTDLSSQTTSLNNYNLSSGFEHISYFYCPTDGGGSNITGRPDDSRKYAFNLKVELLRWASTSDYISKQTYTEGNGKISYVRYCTNGTWSAWAKEYTSTNKPTVSEIGAAASSHTHNYAGSSSAGGAANSATILATARTINGTSFNGSANITTANWGTARSIGIVNSDGTGTAVTTSVNGSANVNLKLPATIKATLTGNASTATTLQTARTINGTSFNGSANITTANWGTARTLTIGNTGKSVNGSGNVSWSLSEIGALPLSGGTLTGEVTFNNYLSINAWSGYGSGKAQLWYNGNTKSICIQPPVEDIQINGKYVYHGGRLPDVMKLLSFNLMTPSTDLPTSWGPYQTSIHFYHEDNHLKHQPNTYGYLVNIGGKNSDVHQIWMTQATGDLLHRGGNENGWHGASGGDGSWRTIIDSENIYNHSSKLSVWWARISQEMSVNTYGSCWIGQGTGDGASYSTHNLKIKSWWGIGFYDHNEWCNMIIDTRAGNVTTKGYMSAASWQTTSDRRLKENIMPLDKKLENLFMELRPVNYYMIEENDKRRHNGFIAQEIEEAMENNGISYEEFAGLYKRNHKEEKTPLNTLDIPAPIFEDEEDEDNVEYSLNYNEFTALNTHMIQKCLKTIEEQAKQIEDLQQKVNRFECMLLQ